MLPFPMPGRFSDSIGRQIIHLQGIVVVFSGVQTEEVAGFCESADI
jgi:hypothetical protein